MFGIITSKRISPWIVIALQGVAIIVLLVERSCKLRNTLPIPIIGEVHTIVKEQSPLWIALRYDSSVAKFEELARHETGWINLKTDPNYHWVDVVESCSILAECAKRGLTNHVQILLDAGADAEEAINWHRKYGWDEAADLIEGVKAALETER